MIRAERATDRAGIRRLLEQAFPTPDEADLVDRLRAAGDDVLALVAVAGDEVAGHVLFSRMEAPFRALGLGPVAVAAERRRAGIGGSLIREGLKRAAAEGWQAVFVLGDPAYYGRFGFDADAAAGFESAYAGPHLMALPLGGALPVREGRIDYAPAFAALG